MEYKKILTSRKLRMRLLDFFSFIPDKLMLKIQYFIHMNRRLDVNNPKRFTEKLQWYKLYYKNPTLIQCVDKYEVRKYIKSIGLEHILNRCYGVYASPNDIDFHDLPEKFVLKDTLGGGGISVIICNDKQTANLDSMKKTMSEWVQTPMLRSGGREWPYYSGIYKHRIICEQFIDSNNMCGLVDYKFFCFNGKVKCLYVMKERVLGEKVSVGIFDKKFRKLNVRRVGDDDIGSDYKKPENYNEMVKIAERVASGFPHVRVDLYNENGKILFGEMTFYNASGYMKYEPDSFDYYLGTCFDLIKY